MLKNSLEQWVRQHIAALCYVDVEEQNKTEPKTKMKKIRVIATSTKTKKTEKKKIVSVVMKKQYDFSKAKKNPYIHDLKKHVTIRLDTDTINYFKHLSDDNGIPYQTLINLYLRVCAQKHKKLQMGWSASKS